MAVTEYRKYQDIIGLIHSDETWRGMMLRTPRIQMSARTSSDNSELLTFGWGNVKVINSGDSMESSMSQKMVMEYNRLAHDDENFVRPCFWLDKDFFKNVKCNLKNIGQYPLFEIRKHSYEELKAIYTDSEMKTLKIYSGVELYKDVVPIATNVVVSGDASVGKTIRAEYEFIRGSEDTHAGLDEAFSAYCWYYSDTPKGEKKVITGTESNKLMITDDLMGKYIWFSVIPKNGFKIQGEQKFSEYVIKVKPKNEINIVFRNESGTEITTLDSINSLIIDMKYTTSINRPVIVCVTKYDSNKQLVLVRKEELSYNFSSSSTISVEPGDMVKVVVLGYNEFPSSIYEIK